VEEEDHKVEHEAQRIWTVRMMRSKELQIIAKERNLTRKTNIMANATVEVAHSERKENRPSSHPAQATSSLV